MVTAITMTYVEEALGVTRAAGEAEIPVAISFTVETDGRLPSGQALGDAMQQVDAETRRAPGLLHDQLRAPDPLRGLLGDTASRGTSASGGSAPTPRG